MPRPRGRTTLEQTRPDQATKASWQEGLLKEPTEPGDVLREAADAALGAAQPHLPGQEPTLRDQALACIRTLEQALALVDDREAKQREKNDSERRALRRESELVRRLMETLPEAADTS